MTDTTPTAALSQIILVDAAFAHRGDPLTVPPELKLQPQRIQIAVNATPFTEEGAIGVRVSISSDRKEDGVLYDFAITMAGILVRTNATPPDWTERQFAEVGTTMLYPFVREALANITGRGRFGAVWLNPFNVQELFEQLDRKQSVAVANS